jgi:putative phage-type endonuclease
MEATAREQWLAERRTGIGGSDAAAILGLSPWAGPMDIWLAKTGQVAEPAETEAMWWGSALEDLVARRYTEKTGRAVYNPERIFRHADHDFIIGTPDRLVVGDRRGVEIKTASGYARDHWGESGTDQVPPHYLVQVLHYMIVTDLPVWDVAVLIGGSDFRIFTVNRDDEMMRTIVDREVEWWTRHIVGGERPPLDGSEGVSKYLAGRFPQDSGEMLDRSGDGYATSYRDRYLEARQQRQRYEALENDAANNLKSLIGDAAGMSFGDGSSITWKNTRGTTSTDWEAVARALTAHIAYPHDVIWDTLVKHHSTERPGVRRFTFKAAR